jgi:cephalosporin hydroxylase
LATLSVNFDDGYVEVTEGGEVTRHRFDTPEAFAEVSRAWVRVGFDNKYVYGFTWLGRPILQLPEDIVRMQEVVYRVKPDVIIETGIAHGGSLVFYAGLCRAMGHGRVIGVDVEIRPHNRAAIESHELFDLIDLVEGSSVDPGTVDEVRSLVEPGETGLVVLDSNHTRDHVMGELEAYSSFVTPGSYLVVADGGIMTAAAGTPLARDDWDWNNPISAISQFLKSHDEFVVEPPAPVFNEGSITQGASYWTGGWLRRTG